MVIFAPNHRRQVTRQGESWNPLQEITEVVRTRWRIPACLALAFGVAIAAHNATAGAPAIAHLRYSADTGANIVGATTFAARKDYVDDDLSGTRTRVQISGLPDTVILRDFHIEPNGDLLFALDTGTTLAGTDYQPADVIRFNGSGFSREFDSGAAGVPPGVQCDGIARFGVTGKLLLSFDHTFAVSGITIRPADVITFSGGAFGAKVLDAKALGLPDTLNVDAIDTFRTEDYLLVSFDSGGAIAGIPFTSADVMQLHRIDGSWSRRFILSTFSDRWNTANLDGLAAVNNDTIFQDDLD